MKKFTNSIQIKWILVICMNIVAMSFPIQTQAAMSLPLNNEHTVYEQSNDQVGATVNLSGVNDFSNGMNQEPNKAKAETANVYFMEASTQAELSASQKAFGALVHDDEGGFNPYGAPDPVSNKKNQDNSVTVNTPTKKTNSSSINISSTPSPTEEVTPNPTPPDNANSDEESAKNPDTAKTEKTAVGLFCEKSETSPKGDKAGKTPRGDSIYMDNEVPFPGSSGLNQCEKLSLGHMKNLYKNGRRTDAIEDWSEFLAYACKSSCSNPTEYNECVSKKMKTAKNCESIAYLLSVNNRDWNDSTQNQADPKGTTSVTTGIVCKSAGIETLDYEPCMKFAKNIDTIEAVQQIAIGTQQLVYQDKMIDAQSKYVNEANAATGALKGQKDSIEMQKEMYQQRTAVDAAKLALLASAYKDMPKLEDIIAQCSSMPRAEITPSNQVTRTDCASAARAGEANFALLQNQKETEKMKTKMFAVAAQAGSSALLSSLLAKRAKDIGKAIAKIDAFQPIDPPAYSESDMTSTFCKQNPALPECLTAGLDRAYDPLADNIITFGEGGLGTNYGAPNLNIESSGTNAISESPTKRDSIGSVGTIVGAAAQDDSIEASNAATVSSDGTASSGGGGGGSGGGVGGGGGGAPPGAGTPGGTQAAIQGKTPSYSGGAGSLSMMGGFGLKPKNANAKEENPFGKLFGKDGAKTSVVNFREIASQKVGDKGDNLFDMISKRYTNVAADKRLLEYELAK